MAENTLASRLAVVRETTEGSLVDPSETYEFIPLQPGFEFVPNVETIENEEIRASIGASKPIQGIEQPTCSFSEYLKHSGVEGLAPNWGILLESLYGDVNPFFSEMTVSASNNKLNFTDDNGTVTATIASDVYRTPQDLATAVTTAMNAANGAQTATCSYSTVTGKFHILSTGTVLELLWKTGANGSDNTDTHIGTLLGYSDAADDTGVAAGTGYTADNATNGIERVLDAGSTTTNLVTTAAATELARGSAVLIKDGTNGYSIRPVDARSTVNLTLGFSVETAPAAGIALGQCVNYTPADSGHPTLSLWMYRANGGAVEAIAGARVTEMSMDVDVGQLINNSFTMEGVQFFMNPLEITSANNDIDFNETGPTLRAASVAVGWYRSPHELAQALQDAMNAVATDTITVVYNDTGASAGKFTISSSGSVLQLLWKTGASGSDNTDTHIGTLLGFSDAANDTGALTYTSDTAQDWSSAITPAFDDADPMVAKNMEVLIGDQTDYETACAQTFSVRVTNEKNNVRCISAESGVDGSVIRRRTSEITIVAQLQRHDVDKFDRFINNTDTKFLFNYGTKSGGNWVAGTCGCIYVPTGTVSAYEHGDDNGLVTMEYTIRPFVDEDGNPEIYQNFL